MITKLQLARIQLKDFRCFEQTTIDLDSPIVLICGKNGAGKTSLLEALHYGCYLRSFRTHLARELVALGKDSFFIKFLVRDVVEEQSVEHTIQVGFADNKRLVKIDNQTASTYKDLLAYYRVISLTEDDLQLVQDGPEIRRDFLDSALSLDDASFVTKIRSYKTVLENRNALLQCERIDADAYFVWTKTLWEHTIVLQESRKIFLAQLETEVNRMIACYIDENLSVSFNYQAKRHSNLEFEQFLDKNGSLSDLMRQEMHFKRSAFGAHVDDFSIILEGKRSRAYASRGQQKMIVLLIKIAQLKQLMLKNGPIIFLLDDFMTDFDIDRSKALLNVLCQLQCQLIFTSPRRDSSFESALIDARMNYKAISI